MDNLNQVKHAKTNHSYYSNLGINRKTKTGTRQHKAKIVNTITLCCARMNIHIYLANKDRPWKYQPLADAMIEIIKEDE